MFKRSSIVYESPLTPKGKKEMKHSRKKMYAMLDSVKKDKRFKKYYKNRNKMSVVDKNRDVKLKLINNKKILLDSVELYKQWQFKVTKESNHIVSVISKKSDQEIVQIFNQLNEIYLKANQDIIKLLSMPRYKELKLKMIDYIDEYSENLIKNRKLDMNRMMEFAKIKNEMEQIEIDNLLFPEINWGSWF